MKLVSPSNRTRILVVDDDPIAAESLAEFLQAEAPVGASGARGGFDTAVAYNGEEALKILDEAASPTTPGTAPRPRPANAAPAKWTHP